ncbi:hypothetical protein [Streptomyces sp. ActVer]|uniref:hypothetical protein n=1 Tax=Streptomyces sp. ActVer TaxID=3014558 RepID=UPI002F96D942
MLTRVSSEAYGACGDRQSAIPSELRRKRTGPAFETAATVALRRAMPGRLALEATRRPELREVLDGMLRS